MLQISTYAPNLDKLFESFDLNCGAHVLELPEGNDYLRVLLDNNVLQSKDGVFSCGLGWDFMTQQGERRRSLFRTNLSNRDEVKELMNLIGAGPASAEILKEKSSLQGVAVLSLLSWMESLDMISLQNGLYYPNLSYDVSSEEEYEVQDGTYNVEIDIKEDKYSVFEYLRKINKDQIILKPDFQRNLVWKHQQKSKFIESILMNMPIPPIYLKKESGGKFIVVDGLQRTSTLLDFINNEYALEGLTSLASLNGCYFRDLDKVQDGLSARIEDRQLYFYIMLPSVPMNIVYDVFNRINTGGTQLTRQEIRNCVFPGPATNLLRDIAGSETFIRSIDKGIQPLRMKDREAVLRCLAYIVIPDYRREYPGSLDEFLEKAMRVLNKKTSSEIGSLKQTAISCYDLTFKVFGNKNFRIPTEYTRGRINLAIMETVFHCFYGINSLSESKVQEARTAMQDLLGDEGYINSVVASTASVSQVLTRFEKAHRFFDNILDR